VIQGADRVARRRCTWPYNRASSVDDYRGITISPLLSKILEKCVLDKFGEYFKSSVNQFGFKKNIGCQHAIYVLRSTVDYFVNKHSTVNICSLDVAKAFDRINHYRMYIKLMERLVPVNIVMLLFNTYKLSSAVVNWNAFPCPTRSSLAFDRVDQYPLSFLLFMLTVSLTHLD